MTLRLVDEDEMNGGSTGLAPFVPDAIVPEVVPVSVGFSPRALFRCGANESSKCFESKQIPLLKHQPPTWIDRC